MFEVLGAVLGDAKPTRSRVEDVPLVKSTDGPEFATLLQGQDNSHPAQIDALIAAGEPSATADFGRVDVPADTDDAEALGSKSATDSFPILLSRGDAKPAEREILDAPAEHVQRAAKANDAAVEAGGDVVKLPSLLPDVDRSGANSTQNGNPIATLSGAPNLRGSEGAEVLSPETTLPHAQADSAWVPKAAEQTAPAADLMAREAAGVSHTPTPGILAPQGPVTPKVGDESVRKDPEGLGAPEQRLTSAGHEGRALPAAAAGMTETVQKQQLVQHSVPASSWAAPHSKRGARSADEDAGAVTIRSVQPAQPDRAATIAAGTTAGPQVAGAPLFANAPQRDDPNKIRFEKEALALDAMPAEMRGSERSAASTSVTSLAPGRAELPAHVAQQLAQALRGSPKGPVEVALQPEELGRVRMTISASEAGVVVSISAERQETFDMMRRHAASLSKELADLGFGSVDLSFEQRDERPSQTPDHAHFEGLNAPNLPESEVDVLHEVGPPSAGGLDSTKALDKRI